MANTDMVVSPYESGLLRLGAHNRPAFGNQVIKDKSGFAEIILGCATERAGPVGRQINERGSWSDAGIRIPDRRIINIPAKIAYITFHVDCLSF
jgi:hypothetical protein